MVVLLLCDGYYICDHLSKTLVRTSMYIEKKRILEIICEITHTIGKYLQGLMGQRKLQIKKKTRYHLTGLAMESSKIFVSFP